MRQVNIHASLLTEIGIAKSSMRICRRPKTPARVNIIDVPQIVMCPELEVVPPKIITVHRTNVLVLVRFIPMPGMLMLAEV
jgi:hypothetical protein